MAALPVFDKVVGGLCWCIASSGTPLDADILFNEELSLGAKMRVFFPSASHATRRRAPSATAGMRADPPRNPAPFFSP